MRYYHNGAEGSRDQIELVLKLVPVTGFLLPAYLQVKCVCVYISFNVCHVADTLLLLYSTGIIRLRYICEGCKNAKFSL